MRHPCRNLHTVGKYVAYSDYRIYRTPLRLRNNTRISGTRACDNGFTVTDTTGRYDYFTFTGTFTGNSMIIVFVQKPILLA